MKKLLLVVDYQVDFVSGSLGFPAAPALEEGIADLVQAYKAAGDRVIFTLDTHPADYLSTYEGKHLPVPHCVLGTPGHGLYGKLAELTGGCTLLCKPTFGSAELLTLLQKEGADEVLIVGLVTNICVIANAIIAKTALPEADIVIDAALCSSFDPKLHEEALNVLEGLQCKVLNR